MSSRRARYDRQQRIIGATNRRGLNLNLDLEGFDFAAANLDQTGARMKDLRPGFEKVIDVLEGAEAQHFADQGGRYVLTGDLRASLTLGESTHGAVREAGEQELVFGTSIFYAKFLRAKARRPRKGPQYGVTKKGKPIPQSSVVKKKGRPSAVLVLPPKARKESSELLLGYITGRVVL